MRSAKQLVCALTAAAVLFSFSARAESSIQTLTLAGGCFWGMEAVFEHVRGVKEVVSGYVGGEAATAQYKQVSAGSTGHAESVQVTFDPAQVPLEKLLDIYFTVAHNPTQLNYQGPDRGTQYRSEIFYASPEQQKVAAAAIAKLEQEKRYGVPVVTKLEPFTAFYPAEAYHQDFAMKNPSHPYILAHDAPKVEKLKENFPDLYIEKSTTPSADPAQ